MISTLFGLYYSFKKMNRNIQRPPYAVQFRFEFLFVKSDIVFKIKMLFIINGLEPTLYINRARLFRGMAEDLRRLQAYEGKHFLIRVKCELINIL